MDDIVFFIDCDNTLLDNDQVQQDLGDYLAREFGAEARERYWQIFEELREQLGYVDYLGALQRYRAEHLDDPRLLRVAAWMVSSVSAARASLNSSGRPVRSRSRHWPGSCSAGAVVARKSVSTLANRPGSL